VIAIICVSVLAAGLGATLGFDKLADVPTPRHRLLECGSKGRHLYVGLEKKPWRRQWRT
jgi:hypothetical protein